MSRSDEKTPQTSSRVNERQKRSQRYEQIQMSLRNEPAIKPYRRRAQTTSNRISRMDDRTGLSRSQWNTCRRYGVGQDYSVNCLHGLPQRRKWNQRKTSDHLP